MKIIYLLIALGGILYLIYFLGEDLKNMIEGSEAQNLAPAKAAGKIMQRMDEEKQRTTDEVKKILGDK